MRGFYAYVWCTLRQQKAARCRGYQSSGDMFHNDWMLEGGSWQRLKSLTREYGHFRSDCDALKDQRREHEATSALGDGHWKDEEPTKVAGLYSDRRRRYGLPLNQSTDVRTQTPAPPPVYRKWMKREILSGLIWITTITVNQWNLVLFDKHAIQLRNQDFSWCSEIIDVYLII